MAKHVILNFMDGQSQEARLAAPFKADDGKIDVILNGENKGSTIALQKLCSILIEGKPDKALNNPMNNGNGLEEVKTITNESYKVHILPKRQYKTGFYGVPADQQSPYQMIFFPHQGVKKRVETRPVGEILEEKGMVSGRKIQSALDEQHFLRQRRVGEIIAEDNNLEQEVIESTIETAIKLRQPRKDERVGDILVSSGLVTREQVSKALESQKKDRRKKIGELLIEKGYINEDQLLSALATKFRLKFVSLENIDPSHETLNCLSQDIIERLQVFPIEADASHIVVATSDPTNYSIVESLRFTTGRNIVLAVASSKQIAAAIEKYLHEAKGAVDDIIVEMADEDVMLEEEQEDTSVSESDSQVIRLVNSLLIDAYKQGVSDIHFEPKQGPKPLQVRYRFDGQCIVKHQVSANYKRAVIARLKIMSNLDIAERRKPQSGKIILNYNKRKIEYRLEVTPTVGGGGRRGAQGVVILQAA